MQAKRRQIASCRLTMQNKIEIYVYKSLGKIGKNNVSNVKFEKDEDKGYCAISEKKVWIDTQAPIYPFQFIQAQIILCLEFKKYLLLKL